MKFTNKQGNQDLEIENILVAGNSFHFSKTPRTLEQSLSE